MTKLPCPLCKKELPVFEQDCFYFYKAIANCTDCHLGFSGYGYSLGEAIEELNEAVKFRSNKSKGVTKIK